MDNQNNNQTPLNTNNPQTTAADQPAAAAPSVTAPPPSPPKKSRKPLLFVLAVLVVALVAGGAGYVLGAGKPDSAPQDNSQSLSADIAVEVPAGATQLSECAKGRGAQFARTEDIPTGPVYNVFEGKVIGIEFMVGKDDLLSDEGKNFLNLPLLGAKYDHVNIGLLSQGHAGFPEPHYHVDVMMVPTSITDTITCE